MKKTFNILASSLSIILGIIMGYCSFILYVAFSIVDSNNEGSKIELLQKFIFCMDIFLCIAIVLLATISLITYKKNIKWIKIVLTIMLSVLYASFLIAMNINNEKTEVIMNILVLLILVPIVLEILSLVIKTKEINLKEEI